MRLLAGGCVGVFAAGLTDQSHLSDLDLMRYRLQLKGTEQHTVEGWRGNSICSVHGCGLCVVLTMSYIHSAAALAPTMASISTPVLPVVFTIQSTDSLVSESSL